MKIITEEVVAYKPKVPFAVETAKDLLKLLGKEPSNRNALLTCMYIDKHIQ